MFFRLLASVLHLYFFSFFFGFISYYVDLKKKRAIESLFFFVCYILIIVYHVSLVLFAIPQAHIRVWLPSGMASLLTLPFTNWYESHPWSAFELFDFQLTWHMNYPCAFFRFSLHDRRIFPTRLVYAREEQECAQTINNYHEYQPI
jgi:hypothetical protein